MRRLAVGFSGLVLMIVLCGCEAGQALAPRKDVEAEALQTFPAENIRLVNNKLFLWRKGMTPDDAAMASKLSRAIDDLDDAAFALGSRQNQLLEKVGLKRLFDAEKTLESVSKDLKKAEKDLKKEQTRPNPNAELIEQLRDKVAVLAQDKVNQEAVLEELRGTVDPTGIVRSEYDQNQQQLDANELDGIQNVQTIMEIVDWFKEQPTSVSFVFDYDDEGLRVFSDSLTSPTRPVRRISASISGWNFGDDQGVRSFSTEDGTITDLVYRDRGGVFMFNVKVDADIGGERILREVYKFKIGRAKLDLTQRDGRIFFAGEITVDPDEQYCSRTTGRDGFRHRNCMKPRRGLAKLVDRNAR